MLVFFPIVVDKCQLNQITLSWLIPGKQTKKLMCLWSGSERIFVILYSDVKNLYVPLNSGIARSLLLFSLALVVIISFTVAPFAKRWQDL